MPSALLQQLDTFGPEHCQPTTYAQAAAYTRALAESHYENFTVVSWFLPKHLREDFHHVYAFCRWADDLGDETGDRQKSIELLNWWRREVDACYADQPRHPVFVALHPTIRRHDIPRKPFDDLIDAFVQDQTVLRYDTWAQVVDYCTRSADPVGRLVLYLCGHRDEPRQRLSDATCTALQLANFWQDVRRDIVERQRVYVPHEVARRHGLDIDTLVQVVQQDERSNPTISCSADSKQNETKSTGCNCARVPGVGVTALLPAYRATLRELVERTWPLFHEGRKLWPMLEPQVRLDIQLFTLGGESILKMIERQNYDTLTHRPSLSKGAKMTLMMRALTGKLLAMSGITR